MFLIQGVFFQEQEFFQPMMVSGDGMVAGIRSHLIYDMFGGVIFRDPKTQELSGGMTDHYGESVLSNISMTETRFSFVKQYNGRGDNIAYLFEKGSGNLWIGGYQGVATGAGNSHCILTEVPDDFFVPKPITK